MSIRNILVAFNGADASVSALKYAAALAKAKGAHLTAILAHATHQTINSRAAYVPEAARRIIEDADAKVVSGIIAQFEALRADLGLGDRLHFIEAAGRVDKALTRHARCFDMLVIGVDPAEPVDEHVLIHPDRIALASGRPLLLVPPGYDWTAPHASAAVAWDGGRAAARALSDVLLLLGHEGKLSLVTVGEPDADIDAVAAQVSRHGLEVERRALSAENGVSKALLRYCDEADPAILAMGAYEHSKFREDFLGGVTAEVFKHIRIPVLMSH